MLLVSFLKVWPYVPVMLSTELWTEKNVYLTIEFQLQPALVRACLLLLWTVASAYHAHKRDSSEVRTWRILTYCSIVLRYK